MSDKKYPFKIGQKVRIKGNDNSLNKLVFKSESTTDEDLIIAGEWNNEELTLIYRGVNKGKSHLSKKDVLKLYKHLHNLLFNK